MALSKIIEIPKIEVVNDWVVQVATDTVIKEDGKEISRSRHRHALEPFQSNYDNANKKWVHTATDISGEATNVQAICNAAWTDTVKANYKKFVESQEV